MRNEDTRRTYFNAHDSDAFPAIFAVNLVVASYWRVKFYKKILKPCCVNLVIICSYFCAKFLFNAVPVRYSRHL